MFQALLLMVEEEFIITIGALAMLDESIRFFNGSCSMQYNSSMQYGSGCLNPWSNANLSQPHMLPPQQCECWT